MYVRACGEVVCWSSVRCGARGQGGGVRRKDHAMECFRAVIARRIVISMRSSRCREALWVVDYMQNIGNVCR